MNGWIFVGDQVPLFTEVRNFDRNITKKSVPVLAVVKESTVRKILVARYTQLDFSDNTSRLAWFAERQEGIQPQQALFEVTHWMPLPELPKP